MRSKLFTGIFVLVFLLTSVSALVKLEIQTLADHEIFITEIDAYSGSSNTPVASPFSTFTGDEGKLILDYTPHKSIFKLGFLLKDDAGMKSIGYTVFDDGDELLHDGKLVKVILLKDEKSIEELEITEEPEVVVAVESNLTEELENETLVEEILTEDSIENSSLEVEESKGNSTGIMKGILIHGNAILQENKSIVNVIAYIFGGIILVVPLLFFFKKRLSKKGSLSLMKSVSSDEDDFEKAEADLKKARERIDELKGKKLEDAKKKLLEDERELMRLRNLGRD